MAFIYYDIGNEYNIFPKKESSSAFDRTVSKQSKISISYILTNCPDETEGYDRITDYLAVMYPAGYGVQHLLPVSINFQSTEVADRWEAEVEFRSLTEAEQLAWKGGLWVGDNYTIPTIREDQIHFSGMSIENEHMEWSLGTQWAAKRYSNVPLLNFDGAMGVSTSGRAGVDKQIGGMNMKIVLPLPRYYFQNNSRANLKKWADLLYSTNDDTFASFASNNVLFTGFSIEPTYLDTGFNGQKDWYITANLDFQIRGDLTYTFLGEEYTRQGWDYTWWFSSNVYRPDGQTEPWRTQMTCDRIYYQNDFSQFGFTFEA